jgi:predicted ATPase
MRPPCGCDEARHAPRRIALTGGPGAGKTAVLEVVQRHFCEHVIVLPEAASILFRGGFPRHESPAGRHAAQRAIYRTQVELERLACEESRAAIVLCDRGTIDSEAYWDGAPGSFWAEVGSTRAAELARYAAVIHLRTPSADGGYDHENPLRIETAEQALAIDRRIFEVWAAHPARTVIASEASFIDKLRAAIEAIRREVPPCCRPDAASAS